jgi:hypothetical protein
VTLERDITAQILAYLPLRGCFAVKILGHLGQRRGLPDIHAIFRGHALWIEVKQPQRLNTPKQITRHLSPEQRRELSAIVRAGGWAWVVDDVSQVMQLLEVKL